MSYLVAYLPSEQEAIRAKCFHPTRTLIEFKKEEMEKSIPGRFEKFRNSDGPDRCQSSAPRIAYHALNKIANTDNVVVTQCKGEGYGRTKT